MTQSCFICNILVGVKDVPDLFAESVPIDEHLTKLLADIVDKSISEESVHSNIICKKCHTTCMEYERTKKRLQDIKTDLTNQFKTTLPKHGLDYNMYPKRSPSVTPKKLVLPASKLQPLPPNYVIDISKLPKNLSLPSSPKINFKPTVGSSGLTHSIKTTQASPQIETVSADKAVVESNIANSLSSILGTKTETSVSQSTSMLTFNVNSLPKDFLADKPSGGQEMKKEVGDDDDIDDDLNNDDQPMEIDEECTITKISKSNIEQITLQDNEDGKQLFDVSLLPITDGADNTIVGKLQILDDGIDDGEEGEEDSIMMTDDTGTVIRFMVSGQKLVYENGTLMLQQHDDNTVELSNDEHDSNDESQIELQVSGDEETANAIIAAAQEQGGAFIKVESGEMFRVKSVKSQKATEPKEDSAPTIRLVALEGDNFKCRLCENVDKGPLTENKNGYGDAEYIMQHLKDIHNARIYICRICKLVMRRRTDYTAHSAECGAIEGLLPGKSKVHECAKCLKKYTSRTLLQEHMNIHLGTRPYKCTVCNKAFASKYTHQAHLKTHEERPRPFKCKQCPKAFLTQQNLNQHEKTHLGIKDFICVTCGKAFGTQHNLEVHGVVHSKTKPFLCGVCGKGFARRAEVKDHMRIHTGERPFSCDICGATFKQRSNLNSHRRATHMDDKRYHCSECPKRFKRRRLLEYHIKVSHTGERPLECTVCHATFVYPEHFKKHARIHSGEKPYKCEVCGKSFNSRDNRNTHRFVHSDKKPYECLVCGAGFMRKQLLYAHMNTSGHLAESIVVNQPRVQKVNEKGSKELQTDNKIELIFPAANSEELELTGKDEQVVIAQEAPKYIVQEAKNIHLVQEPDEPALLTFIHNIENKQEHSIAPDSMQESQVQMVTTDENGQIRVVQLQLGAAGAFTLATQ